MTGAKPQSTSSKVQKKDNKVVVKEVKKPNFDFNNVSWDVLRVIIRFLPLSEAPADNSAEQLYKKIRLVNRDFYALICQ